MKRVLLVANVSKEHIRKFHIPFILKMKQLGWQVDVACHMDDPIPECDHCYNFPCDRNPFKGGIIKSTIILKEILQTNHYDVIHCNTITGSLVGRMAAKSYRKNGLKVVYTNHGLHFYKGAPAHRWILGLPMEKALARLTDVLITINETDYQAAQTYLKSCGRIERIHGIGVNLSRFRQSACATNRAAVRKKSGISTHDFVLTYVAEINSNKNQAALLEVFQIIRQTIPEAKLLLVGPDHTNGEFGKLVHRKGLENKVILTGWRDDVPALLIGSDVYVASSKSEGLGLNLIEAMACNLPVVAFKNRGHCEIIKHGTNGFLVEQDDIETMASYIIELYHHPELRRKLTHQAQHDICPYEVENVWDEIHDIYTRLNA